MFGKKRERQLEFDHWCGDPEAQALRNSLEAGHVGPFESAYLRSDVHRREFLLQNLVLDLPGVAAIEQWPQTDPASPLAYLARGAQRISSAWEARGRGRSTTVGEDAWEIFFSRLRDAESDLRRSLELGDDGVAWSQLLISGRGLQLTTDELRARYARATERSPGLTNAAEQLLQSLCAKWHGSNEEMFEFARDTCATAPPNDPRHRLIAIAHFERWLEFRDDAVGQVRYKSSREAQEELVGAAQRSVLTPQFGTTPQHVLTVNWFAWALCHFGRPEMAPTLFQRIGGRPTPMPWDYFNNPPFLFARYRLASGASR